ncbi:MAG: hypothetical protein ACPIOQ_73545, partial [Promethearchaeia archaeon]
LPGARSPRRDADAVLPLHVYEQRQGRSAPQCNGCQAPFSLLRYRHRCDPCGMVRFSLALLRPLRQRIPVRVCCAALPLRSVPFAAAA